MASRWKCYKGFSRYLISNKGSVYDKKLKCYVARTPNEDGYLKVTLRDDNEKRKSFSVHRLVAICFIPNPNKLPEVNHKDGVKKRCTERNLEWVTHKDNIQHAWDTGLLKKDEKLSKRMSAIASLCVGAKNHKSTSVYCVTTKETFESMCIAARYYSAQQAQISKCCNNKAKSAGKHPITGEPLKWRFGK